MLLVCVFAGAGDGCRRNALHFPTIRVGCFFSKKRQPSERSHVRSKRATCVWRCGECGGQMARRIYSCHCMRIGWHWRRTSAGLVTHCVHPRSSPSTTFLTGRVRALLSSAHTCSATCHHTPRQSRPRCCQSVQRFRNTRMRSGNSRIKQIAGKCSPPKVALIYEGEWQVTA